MGMDEALQKQAINCEGRYLEISNIGLRSLLNKPRF